MQRVTHDKEAGTVRGWNSQHYQGCQEKVGKDSGRRKVVAWIGQPRGNHYKEAGVIRRRKTKYCPRCQKALGKVSGGNQKSCGLKKFETRTNLLEFVDLCPAPYAVLKFMDAVAIWCKG